MLPSGSLDVGFLVELELDSALVYAQLAKIPSTMKVNCVGFGIIQVMPQGLGTMRDLIRILEKMVHSEGFFKVLTVLFTAEMVVF